MQERGGGERGPRTQRSNPLLPHRYCRRNNETRWIRGVRLGLWKSGHPEQRARIAFDLTHFKSLERIRDEGRAAVLVDDTIRLTKGWWGDLLATVKDLPEVRGAGGWTSAGLGGQRGWAVGQGAKD